MGAPPAVRGGHASQLLVLVVALLSTSCAHGQTFACSANGTYATWYSPNICAALGELYASTRGASWTTRTGWSAAAAGTPTDYCSFYGITCSSGGSTKGLNVMCVPLPPCVPLRSVPCLARSRLARTGCPWMRAGCGGPGPGGHTGSRRADIDAAACTLPRLSSSRPQQPEQQRTGRLAARLAEPDHVPGAEHIVRLLRSANSAH
jgi:hypothetical protein